MNNALPRLTIASLASAMLIPAALAAQADAPITAHYTCAGGSSLHVVFEGEKATVTPSGGQAVTLPQALTADGFQYSDSTHSLRGRGNDATWTVGTASVECTAPPANERG